MAKRVFRIREGEPLLDIVSYGSSALRENGDRLSPAQIEQIRRTVQRVPEVMVKVLPRASNDLKAARKHLDYISRNGKLPLEVDDGEPMEGRNGKVLLEAWDLDIDDVRRQAGLTALSGRKPPKVIHKLMFSMPAGTSPDKVLSAVRNFAREQFWGQHRYAFTVHTDEDHPHVHLVLKAVSEQGMRLNIRKTTLRHWRSEFARNLRLLGVAANATERAVRGESRSAVKDGVYRASLRGESRHLSAVTQAVAAESSAGCPYVDRHRRALESTRENVVGGWNAVAKRMLSQGEVAVAIEIGTFLGQMSPPSTDRDRIAQAIAEFTRSKVPITPGLSR